MGHDRDTDHPGIDGLTLEATPLGDGLRPALRGLAALAATALVVFVAWTLGLGGGALATFFNHVVYNALVAAGAAACLLRAALVRSERLPWLVMGIGMLAWGCGELAWTLLAAGGEGPPAPSLADPLYLLFYLASYATLGLLVHSRVRARSAGVWIDGAIAGLAVAALAAALAFGPIAAASEGTRLGIAINMAYPIGDLTLLAMVVAVFGLSGWRPGRAWGLIGAGLALTAVADGIYLLLSAKGSYVEGTPLDALWPAAALLVGLAAWHPARIVVEPPAEDLRAVVLPLGSTLVALALLTYDHFVRLSTAALGLTVAALLLAAVRMTLTFVQNGRMLSHSHDQALTDALTGLRNRRALMSDLERELACLGTGDERVLVVYDLDGFKQYNDSFGHPAGDALLARLGHRLQDAVAGHGCAYRLGGDEFCALIRLGDAGLEPIVAAPQVALSEHGEGFAVRTSHGAVVMPRETESATEALQLADQRMYARKGGRRGSAGRQSRDVLLSALREREPELHRHLLDVAGLAVAVGGELGMSTEQLDEVARAAELHDIGQVAIPDAILRKPGPLAEDEWSFVRRHTLIGERILLSAPALRPVAGLVRSSHERWDGKGYPDGLAGDDIALGARIVAACDAFLAMTSGRPYQAAISREAALEELDRCSGTQFDPTVVRALQSVARAEVSAREPDRAAV